MIFSMPLPRLAALLGAISLSACGGNAGVAAVPSFSNVAAPHSSSSQANLFVENFLSICEYTTDGRLVRIIKKGFTQKGGTRVGGLTLDSSGTLYAITGYFSVSVYTPVTRKLLRIITDGIHSPFALATDSKDNLYVGNGITNTVAVYPPGAMSPSRTITQGIDNPVSLAFDSKGKLYVANLSGNTVTVYAPNGTLVRTIGAIGPNGIALDKHDDLVVGDATYGTTNFVNVYKPPNDKLRLTITKAIRAPWAVAIDSAHRIFVSNANGRSVTVYDSMTGALVRKIYLNKEPGPLALDSSNHLFVGVLGNPATVNVYGPNHRFPKFVITKGIVVPLALAIGPP